VAKVTDGALEGDTRRILSTIIEAQIHLVQQIAAEVDAIEDPELKASLAPLVVLQLPLLIEGIAKQCRQETM
jgi:hypothetical protein